jgi:uncharacterized membrane protein
LLEWAPGRLINALYRHCRLQVAPLLASGKLLAFTLGVFWIVVGTGDPAVLLTVTLPLTLGVLLMLTAPLTLTVPCCWTGTGLLGAFWTVTVRNWAGAGSTHTNNSTGSAKSAGCFIGILLSKAEIEMAVIIIGAARPQHKSAVAEALLLQSKLGWWTQHFPEVI